MAPDPRPIPRFIADDTQEGIPYGRFAERLTGAFRESCGAIEDRPEGAPAPGEPAWFPERRWGGRVWIPATARAGQGEEEIEYFGHVSYVEPPDGEPGDFKASADFTDVLAEYQRDWRIDLNDDVIGRWRGENDRAGAVTLVWGRPLVRGAVAATAELEDTVVDQTALRDGRFTLVALDALEAYGDDVYMEVRLWGRRGDELAAESLYDEAEEGDEADAPPAGPDSSVG
jgi:hypothetical protein